MVYACVYVWLVGMEGNASAQSFLNPLVLVYYCVCEAVMVSLYEYAL